MDRKPKNRSRKLETRSQSWVAQPSVNLTSASGPAAWMAVDLPANQEDRIRWREHCLTSSVLKTRNQCGREAPRRRRRLALAAVGMLSLASQSCVWLEPVSVDDSGATIGAAESQSAVSQDGRYVVFVTAAALVAEDNNALPDVYRRDMASGSVALVSATASGSSADAASGEPDISNTGDTVAFTSAALDLWPTANGQTQVYVRTISSAATVLASVATDGIAAGDGASGEPSLARDGSAVAFASVATNLAPVDANGVSDIFNYAMAGATVTRISVDPGGIDADGASTAPASNTDGTAIVFTSQASNLVAGDTNGVADVFLASGAAITRVSQGALGEADGPSSQPALAADTAAVVFASDATNLVAGDDNGATDVFVREPDGAIQRLSSNGAFGYSLPSTAPVISANGQRVAFLTDGANIDQPAGTTAVIADRVVGRVDALATAKSSDVAVAADGITLSADGAIASFNSDVSLDVQDTNEAPDIYTRFTYPTYIWMRSLLPGIVTSGTVTPVTLSGYGFVVGGLPPELSIPEQESITFSDVVVVDSGTITAVMTVPGSVSEGTYTLLLETPGNRADMEYGRSRSCPCLTVAAPIPPRYLSDIGPETGISGPDGPTSNTSVDDYNGDSLPDILHLRHGYSRILLLGNGDGVTPQEILPLAIADQHECDSADVNNDGLVDIFCSVGADKGSGVGNNSLWLRQPNGSYTDVAAKWGVTDPYGRGREVTFLNANNDAYPDLYVTNYPPRTDGQISENHLFLNNAGTGFVPAPEFGVDGHVGYRCAVATDFDNDGDEDLVVCDDGPVRMYANQGGSGFIDVATANGFTQRFHGAAFADIDNDGDLDVAFSAPKKFFIYRMQNGVSAGQLFSYPATEGHKVAFGEINGDGIPDAYFVQRGCRNEAEGNLPDFVAVSEGASWVLRHPPDMTRGCGDDVVAYDHDGDGVDGFVVSNGRDRNGPLQYLVAPPGC